MTTLEILLAVILASGVALVAGVHFVLISGWLRAKLEQNNLEGLVREAVAGGSIPPELLARIDRTPVARTSGAMRHLFADIDDLQNHGTDDVGARTIQPLDVRRLHDLATILRREGRREEALELLRQALDMDADDASSLHNAAAEAESAGDRELAAELYRKSLILAPANPRFQANYADCLSQMPGKEEEASAIFESLANEALWNDQVATLFLKHLVRHGRFDRARTLLLDRKPGAVSPRFAESSAMVLLEHAHEIGLGEKAATRALEALLKMGHPGPLAAVAGKLMDLGDLDKGATFYARALEAGVPDAVRLVNLAIDLSKLKAPASLVGKVWRLPLEAEPHNEAYWAKYLTFLANSGAISGESYQNLLARPTGPDRLHHLAEIVGGAEDTSVVLTEVLTLLRKRIKQVPSKAKSKKSKEETRRQSGDSSLSILAEYRYLIELYREAARMGAAGAAQRSDDIPETGEASKKEFTLIKGSSGQ